MLTINSNSASSPPPDQTSVPRRPHLPGSRPNPAVHNQSPHAGPSASLCLSFFICTVAAWQVLTGKLPLTLSPLTPRSDGGQVEGQRDPEAGSGGAGAPVPEGAALSSCWISMVGRDAGMWGAVVIKGGDWGLRPNPFGFFPPQMRTVTRVSIQKAPCRRARSPALGAPPSPAALCHLLDHRKGSQRMLSPHSWARREVGPDASQEPALLSLLPSKVEATSLPLCQPFLLSCLPEFCGKSPPFL